MGIMDYVWPEVVRSFSMVCKREYELSGSMVMEHRKSKLEHSYLQIIKETLPSTLSDYCTGFRRSIKFDRALLTDSGLWPKRLLYFPTIESYTGSWRKSEVNALLSDLIENIRAEIRSPGRTTV